MMDAPQVEALPIPAQAQAETVAKPISKETNSSASLRREHLKLKDREGATKKEQDVSLTTGAIIGEEGNKILKGQKLEPALLKKSVGKTEAPVLLFSYLLRPDFKGITLSEGLKVVAAGDGSFTIPQSGSKEGESIKQVFKREGQFFSCDLGDGKQTMIPIETVLTADVVSIFSDEQLTQKLVKDGLFTPQEIQIIQAYVDSATGKGSSSADKINGQTLKEAALSSGLVTAESLKSFSDANMKLKETDLTKIEAATDEEKVLIAAKNTVYNQQVEQALKLFEGRLVASPEAVAAVVQTVLPEQIKPLKSTLNEKLVKIKLELAQLNVNDPKDRQKLANLSTQEEQINQQLMMVQQAEGFMKDGQIAVMEVFGSVQRGEIGTETTQALDQGLKENNPEKIMTALVESKKVSEEDVEKVRKIPGFLKIGGGLFLGLFFMLLWKAIKGEGGLMGMGAAAG